VKIDCPNGIPTAGIGGMIGGCVSPRPEPCAWPCRPPRAAGAPIACPNPLCGVGNSETGAVAGVENELVGDSGGEDEAGE
jgi:hypothetical protein